MIPKFLKSGDKVAIAATARFILSDQLSDAQQLLAGLGMQVVLANNINIQFNQLAGDDLVRANAFQQLIDDEEIRLIWIARGGYGTVKILPYLNWEKFIKSPKWIVGFSDVTVLHIQMAKLGFASIHAEMAFNMKRLMKYSEAMFSLKNTFLGNQHEVIWPNTEINILGNAKGLLIGGNLSVVYSIIADTYFQEVNQNIILFIEDLDEYVYHIDRMLEGLKFSNIYKHIKGVVVGSFSEMKDHKIPWGKDANEIILEALTKLNITIAYNFQAGHIPDNRAFYLNTMVELEVNNLQCALKWPEIKHLEI